MASRNSGGGSAAPQPASMTELREPLRNAQAQAGIAETLNAELRQRVEALESDLNLARYRATLAEERYKAHIRRDVERFHRHAARLSNRRKRNMTAVKEELEKRVKKVEEERDLAKKAAGDTEELRKRVEKVEMERNLAMKTVEDMAEKAANDSEDLRKRVEKAEMERDLAMKTGKDLAETSAHEMEDLKKRGEKAERERDDALKMVKDLEDAQNKLQAQPNQVLESAGNALVKNPEEQPQDVVELKAKLEGLRVTLKRVRKERDTAQSVSRIKGREHAKLKQAWDQERIALNKSGDTLTAKIVTIEMERDLARESTENPGESRGDMELRWETQHHIAIARSKRVSEAQTLEQNIADTCKTLLGPGVLQGSNLARYRRRNVDICCDTIRSFLVNYRLKI
ncbi:hypothetical protein BU16DRAFT_96519 [Lophium mytilinum]|uniref:Uncharacterized protein n=1 Tax=Lophium mytilinum TaxID=390894 RepID=A0A6A6QQC6_9PEZI|nr:hypothetical protein BU16DRAFT_96519 [Lophium mytilinum]